jgi:DNA-binding response OmpR family regulator
VRGFATDSITADLVTTGRDAILHAGATEYAVVVLDIMLPDLDGLRSAAGCARRRSTRRS